MRKRRTSLTDVARAAGVGIATASRALNGNSEVAMATRERVLETASAMGYRPSGAAQSLRTGRSGVISVWLPIPFPAAAVETVFSVCTAAGYHVLLRPLSEHPMSGAQGPSQPAVHVEGELVMIPASGNDGTSTEPDTVSVRVALPPGPDAQRRATENGAIELLGLVRAAQPASS